MCDKTRPGNLLFRKMDYGAIEIPKKSSEDYEIENQEFTIFVSKSSIIMIKKGKVRKELVINVTDQSEYVFLKQSVTNGSVNDFPFYIQYGHEKYNDMLILHKFGFIQSITRGFINKKVSSFGQIYTFINKLKEKKYVDFELRLLTIGSKAAFLFSYHNDMDKFLAAKYYISDNLDLTNIFPLLEKELHTVSFKDLRFMPTINELEDLEATLDVIYDTKLLQTKGFSLLLAKDGTSDNYEPQAYFRDMSANNDEVIDIINKHKVL